MRRSCDRFSHRQDDLRPLALSWNSAGNRRALDLKHIEIVVGWHPERPLAVDLALSSDCFDVRPSPRSSGSDSPSSTFLGSHHASLHSLIPLARNRILGFRGAAIDEATV